MVASEVRRGSEAAPLHGQLLVGSTDLRWQIRARSVAFSSELLSSLSTEFS